MAAKKISDTVTTLNDPDLKNRLALADIIAVEFPDGEKRSLWKRPIEEVMSRGLPANVQAVVFAVATEADFIRHQQAIKQFKNS